MSAKRAALLGALLFLVACGGARTDVPVKPKAPPAEKSARWPNDGIPGTISDLTVFLRRSGLDERTRAMAMFRLAALHEERARAAEPEDEAPRLLAPAIELYQRILRDFPNFEHRAAIHYYLGHALQDVNRIAEGQLAFRALVCHNHASYPDSGTALPQDHDEAYWRDWSARHTSPIDQPNRASPAVPGDELRFVDPFPADCEPLPQDTPKGEAPRYVGEVWVRIGDHWFQEVDPAAGPFALNRAASAYAHAIPLGSDIVRAIALYKLAWTRFKQQRYEAAVRGFVALLAFLDEQEKRTGDRAVDFRAEAHTYIASCLTYVDFVGPREEDPFIPRDDVLDVEHDPAVAEQKMRVAIERAADPAIIPQNAPWTPDIFRALVVEYHELLQYRNEIEVSKRFLERWPDHPAASAVRAGIANAAAKIPK